MAFKAYSKNLSFMDVELRRIFGRSRTQQFLSKLKQAIVWEPIERLLLETYPIGRSEFGNRAYQPLMLLKAILLQKWYGIDSDPELENQINDRLSFKVFIGLPLSQPSPDHSIICRFRERVGKETLERIHHELLQQFKSKGFSIESGMAVDARLVGSASRPLSNKKLDELREERKHGEEGKERSKAVRFQRDLESDWTVRDGEAIFGMKEHASIDVESGLVLTTMISKASEHDTNYFQAVVVKGIHGEKFPWKVYADKGYCSEANRQFLSMNGIDEGIMRKDQVNAKLTEREIQRNKWLAKLRHKIEQYFGLSALYQWAGEARFTGLAREGWDRLLGAVAFNIRRVVLNGRKLATV